MDRPRLVLDTNVLVSGLITTKSPPAQILDAVHKRQAVLLVSDPIVEEYLRVLNYPRIRKYEGVTESAIRDLAAFFINQTERVELLTQLRKCPDPDDDVFLATAVDGKADFLITGDKADLLALDEIKGIPIISARDAITRLNL